MMKLLAASIGQTREVNHRGRTVQTAIWKTAVAGPIHVGKLGLTGDRQADRGNHGGIEQAVYVYDQANYRYWSTELERDDFEYGQFGENFTVSGLTEKSVQIGDILRIGEVLAQVSQPRTPCFKLGLRMDDPTFVKSFTQSCRVGFYLRVLEEGFVSANDAIELTERPDACMSVADVFRIMHLDQDDLEGTARAAKLPALSPEWRGRFQERLGD